MSENTNGTHADERKKESKVRKRLPQHRLNISNKFFGAIFLVYVILLLVVALSFYNAHISMDTPANAEIINGILTVTALVYGFSTFQIEFKNLFKPYRLLLWLIFASQTLMIAIAGFTYYRDFLFTRTTTARSLLASMVALVFNLVSLFLARYVYESMHGPSLKELDEEYKKQSQLTSEPKPDDKP